MAWYEDLIAAPGQLINAGIDKLSGAEGERAKAAAADAASIRAAEMQQKAMDFAKQQSDAAAALYSDPSTFGDIGQLYMGGNVAAQDTTKASTDEALKGVNTGFGDAARNIQTQGKAGADVLRDLMASQLGYDPDKSRLAALMSGGLAEGFQADPGYQARLAAGEQAINRAAAAKGNRLGAATMQALGEYNQNMASDEYQRYAQRAMGAAGQLDAQAMQAALANQQSKASAGSQLAGLYGDIGGQLGTLGMGYGSKLADLAVGEGDRLSGLQASGGQNLAALQERLLGGQANALLAPVSTNASLTSAGMQNAWQGVPYAGGEEDARSGLYRDIFGLAAMKYFGS